MGSFADAVSQWVLKTQARTDRTVRAIGLELLNRIVLRSPVGNPDLWGVNSARVVWNRGAEDVNFELRQRPENLTRAGRLRRGLKVKARRLYRPQGYTGGRFRGNWQLTINHRPVSPVSLIDPNGGPTIARGAAVLATMVAGDSIFITNNVPYAIPLEYGHSSQAPSGVVRVTVAEFQEVVRIAIERNPE